MDAAQLLEALVLVVVTIELVELAYHTYRMRAYEKHVEQHLRKMDAHILKMDQYMNELENRLKKLNE